MRISPRRMLSVATLCLGVSFVSACANEAEPKKPDAGLQKLESNLRIAQIALDNQDAHTAQAIYRKSTELAPLDPRPWIGLGQAALSTRDMRTAITMFSKAIAINPQISVAHMGLGQALLKDGQLKHAERAFAEAVKLPEATASAYNGWGVSLDALERHSDAQKAYTMGIQKFPDVLSLRNNHAFSLAIDGIYDKAVETLLPIADTPTAPQQIKLNLALMYGLAGHVQEAKAWSEQVLTPEQTLKNLSFYESLRALPHADRAKIILDLATSRK